MNYLTIILPIIITALAMNYQLRLTVNLNFRQLLCFLESLPDSRFQSHTYSLSDVSEDYT